MKKQLITTSLIIMVLGLCLVEPAHSQEDVTAIANSPETVTKQDKPLVQMAILLDTSGSMSGLIDQARIELWAVVNEFIFARKNGMEPKLQLSLYEYGKNPIGSKDGYMRQIVPFTTDLDKVSEELFSLRTDGSKEYCGLVIQKATQSLEWSKSPEDLKVIFIAGNEPFTQGPVDFRRACKEAISKGIVVNTIHCGAENVGLRDNWKEGATLADGRFLNIDQNQTVAHIEAPQDKEIAELSKKLNDTYIAFGSNGQLAYQRQAAQDTNASTASKQAEVQRALTKSSFNYKNAEWDLVDAVKDKKVKLDKVETEELPENMQKMTPEQRKAYVETKSKERQQIQQRIQELNNLRKDYVAAEMKKQNSRDNTLGRAMIKAVREQAVGKNLEFQKPQAKPENTDSSEK